MYKISDEEKVLVIKNWLVQEGLLLIETFMHERKGRNVKPQREYPQSMRQQISSHATIIQYVHCNTKNYKGRAMKSVQEWIGRLQTKVG